MKLKLALAAAAVGMAVAGQANAWCTVCWGQGLCVDVNASCNAVAYTGLTCFTGGALAFNPSTDFLEVTSGQAVLVQGGKRTPVVSDARMAELKALNDRFAKLDVRDSKVKLERDRAVKTLLMSPDFGPSSPTLVASLTNGTGLKVRGKR